MSASVITPPVIVAVGQELITDYVRSDEDQTHQDFEEPGNAEVAPVTQASDPPLHKTEENTPVEEKTEEPLLSPNEESPSSVNSDEGDPSQPLLLSEDNTTCSNKRSTLPSAMELNDAYEAVEKMRKLNLELQCSEAGIVFGKGRAIDFDMCTRCLVTKGPPKLMQFENTKPALSTPSGKPLFPALYKFRMDSQKIMNTSNQKMVESLKKNAPPCLLCGSPTCHNHASATFRKEHITLCNDCVTSLEFDFDNDDLEDATVLKERAAHLVDLYDRALLLLKYSSHHVLLPVANSLDQQTQRYNQVGVGSSSVGLVSGALGVAAACTILTPAGPPLLIASLVCGGSATAVQTGSEMQKFFSEPQQVANRILALRGMLQSILETMRNMRERTLLPYLDRAVLSLTRDNAKNNKNGGVVDVTNTQVQKAATTAGVMMGSTAATGIAQLGTAAVQEASAASRFMTRASTNIARSARFAQIAGGALSAATLVLEARELKHAVEQIRQGNPCEKARMLREIQGELKSRSTDGSSLYPTTSAVDAICESYVKVRAKQLRARKLLGVYKNSDGGASSEKEEEDIVIVEEAVFEDLLLVEEVVSSLEATHQESSPTAPERPNRYAPSTRKRVDLTKSSLLERVQRFKERESDRDATIDLVV